MDSATLGRGSRHRAPFLGCLHSRLMTLTVIFKSPPFLVDPFLMRALSCSIMLGALAAGCVTTRPILADSPLLVCVEQDGRAQIPINGQLVLVRHPFTLVLRARPDEGILVNASANPITLGLLPFTNDLDELPGFRCTGMADCLGNPKQELVLSDTAPNYWYFDSNGEHRFDAPPAESMQGSLGRRTVSLLRTHGKESPASLQDWPHEQLHLVFIRSIWRKTVRPPFEGFEEMAGQLRVAIEKQGLTIRFK